MTITSLSTHPSLQTLATTVNATTVNRGALGDQSVHPAPTDNCAERLAGREEAHQGRGLLSRIGAQLIAPFIALGEWVGRLLNPAKSHTAALTTHQPEKSTQPSPELLKLQAKIGLESSVGSLTKALALADVTADNLVDWHAVSAAGDGALRSLATGLRAVEKANIEPYASEAKAITTQVIGGHPVSQWGTIGGKVSEWLTDASTADLTKAAQQIKQLVPQIKQLELAITRESKGEQPLMRISDVDWSAFPPEMNEQQTFDRFKEITTELMTYRTEDGKKTFSATASNNITNGFRDIPVIAETLIDVPSFDGKYTRYNANYVQGGNAIAAQAPKRGENTALFADLLVQEKPALIVNLTEDKDGTVDYFGPGKKTFNNATFESRSGNGFFTELNVKATSGETHSLAFARLPIEDFNGMEIDPLHDAVVKVSAWRDEHPGAGALLVHCRAGVGRTGMFLEALETYRLFNSGNLSLENYREKVLSGVAALRTERGPDTVQKAVQLQANLDYAKALVTGRLHTEKAEAAESIYENADFSRQLEEEPQYMNTGDLQMARSMRSASPQSEPLYVNSEELRAGVSEKSYRPPVPTKPTQH
ncbi:protein-tyrosine phosphatase family protein [Pseudomonas fluorescens]|uniref:Uncharacterized protein n=1 Tax=Pseudomonas fluorescens TaxID=294 RepID=A0A5E7G8I9_PSEFL|nr:protein-tyrosine phosphatase family protein [Pseudomonas fluorescens]VVO48071.1 hypothetical protein PS880_00153 [Pseudomonas fluorescens]